MLILLPSLYPVIGYVTTSSFNIYTSSNDNKVNSLTSATSSYITNSQTSSMTVASASLAQTASYITASNVIGVVNSSSYSSTSSYLPGAISGSGIINILVISASAYAALGSYNSQTLYLVI